MYTILDESTFTITCEESKFIAILQHVGNEREIKSRLEKAKKDYPKAKHYCYAVLINGYSKHSDDGEPKGTAGRPLLELLYNLNMDQVILIVVRYFGGIKLGAGRLLRTYVDVGKQGLDAATKYEILDLFHYNVILDYALHDIFKNMIHELNANIENTEFDILIKVEITAKEAIKEKLQAAFDNQIEVIELPRKQKYQKVEENT